LNRYIAREPGPIKDSKGRQVGEHVGLSFYTLGQRQGLGIGGLKSSGTQKGGGDHAPWFVARKDIPNNTLWVVQGHDHPWLQSRALVASDLSWVSAVPPHTQTLSAKTRYRQIDAVCTLEPALNAPQPKLAGSITLRFRAAQWAVTPGQSAVLYDGDICLGGGVIDSGFN
jgi:tRNA-specific 2-thiouridylase